MLLKHGLLLYLCGQALTFAANQSYLMEFICVLSVDGSLASYLVRKETESRYTAVLRTANGKREDVPPEISLEKGAEGWQATPSHPEIVPGLIHAIEANR